MLFLTGWCSVICASSPTSGLTRFRESAATSTSPTFTTQAQATAVERRGRKQETLKAFFEFLTPERPVAVEVICYDMWQPYIDVIKDKAPQARPVFDKFHIVRRLYKLEATT